MKASFRAHLRSAYGQVFQAPVLLRRLRLPFGIFAGLVLALFGIGLALSGSPLMGVLGYEASALSGLVLTLLLPWNLVHRLAALKAEMLRHPARDDRWPMLAEGHALGWLLACWTLALIPGTMLLLAAWLHKAGVPGLMDNCNIPGGLLWYAGVPLITCTLLLGVSALVMTVVSNPRAGGWWCLAWVFASLLWTARNWLLGPRVAFLHPFMGTVVLPNYSPVVAQDLPFWLSRMLALHWGLLGWSLFLLAWWPKQTRWSWRWAWTWTSDGGWRIARSVHLYAIVVLLLVTWCYRGSLGLDTSYGYLRSQLPAQKSTSHFNIHYNPQSLVAAQIDDLALLHEFHYAAIAKAFQLSDDLIIEVWLYPSNADKERLTGARGSVFAKPWIKTTHVFATGTDVSALRHELTHIMGGEFAPPVSRVNINGGIAEGTSEAIAWDAGPDLTFHQWARGGRELHLASSVEKLMSIAGFFEGRLQLSYATAGSFMRWLIDTYGLEKFKTLYRTYNAFSPFAASQWTQIYGKSLPELEAEWGTWLETDVPFSERDRETVQFTYEQPAFISQQCARVVAESAAKAQQARALGLWDTALAEYDKLWAFQPGNLYHRFGTLAVLTDAERYTEALDVAAEMLDAPNLNQGLRARLHGEIGDIYLRMGDWEKARLDIEMALSLGVFTWQERDARIKLAVLELPEAARGPLIRGLTGPQEMSTYQFARADARIDGKSWIPAYLNGRRFSFAGKYEEALSIHAEFLESDAMQQWMLESVGGTVEVANYPVPEAVIREALLTMAHDAVWAHDLAMADAIIAFSRGATALPWSPADEARLSLAAEYSAFQAIQSLPAADPELGRRTVEALQPRPMPLVLYAPGTAQSDTAIPLDGPQTLPLPGQD